MNNQRDQRWRSRRGIVGGVAMFVIEGLVIAGLATLALIVSAVVLAIL